MVGASIAGVYNYVSRTIGWDAALLVMPVVYLIYHSYRQYLWRLEGGKDHAQDMASLHLRTIEAVSYTHLRAHETVLEIVCRLLLENKKKKKNKKQKKNHKHIDTIQKAPSRNNTTDTLYSQHAMMPYQQQ